MPKRANSLFGVVTNHEGDVAVKRHRDVQLVFEHIQSVHAVRLRPVARARRWLQSHLRRVLWDTHDVRSAVKVDVHTDRSRSERFRVRVGLELLLPAFVAVSVHWRRGRILRLDVLLLAGRAVFVYCAPMFVVVHDFFTVLWLLLFLHGLGKLARRAVGGTVVLKMEEVAAVRAQGKLAVNEQLQFEGRKCDYEDRLVFTRLTEGNSDPMAATRCERVTLRQDGVGSGTERLNHIRYLPARLGWVRDTGARNTAAQKGDLKLERNSPARERRGDGLFAF